MKALLLAAAASLALVAGQAQAQAPAAPSNTFMAQGDPSLNVSFELTAMAEGLDHPWSIAFLPGGDMLVTERPGRLRVIRNGQLVQAPVTGLPPILVAQQRGLVFQAGLFDVSPHPNFAQNRQLYITYAHGTEQENRLRVARGTFDGQALTNLQVIFEVNTPKTEFQHFGGRMMWMPDGTFLLTVGDGGNPPIASGGQNIRNQAQNLGSHLGKVLRLREDGTAPPDNPFVGRAGAAPEVFSFGHRHSQGIARDPQSGRIWSNEHGPLGADELNLVRAGANYGWPAVTFGRDYVGATVISNDTARDGMEAPRLVWTNAVAPSGLAFYTGDRFPAWRGSLLSGSLHGQDIRRIMLDGEGRVTGQESLRIGQRVRDVKQGPDGMIYVLTDERFGRVFRMAPTPGS